MSFFTLRESVKPLARLPIDYQVYAREQAGRCLRIKRVIRRLVLGSCLALTVGCSAIGKSDTFTLTADLPPDFYYKATAIYIPAKGESCTVPGGRNTHVVFNRKWSKEYQQNSEVELFRTVSGCPLSLYGVNLDVFAKYAKGTTDFGTDRKTRFPLRH